MCGIVGYVGPDQALPIILEGLSRLEYRGYDSAGVALAADELDLPPERLDGAVLQVGKRHFRRLRVG